MVKVGSAPGTVRPCVLSTRPITAVQDLAGAPLAAYLATRED